MHDGGDRPHVGLDHDPPAHAADLGDLVDNENCFEKAEAGTAILFRDRHAEEARIGQRLHVLPWVLLGAVDFGRARRDGFARQRTRTLLQLLLEIAQRHEDPT